MTPTKPSFTNQLCLVINATKTPSHGLRLTLLSQEQDLFYANASGMASSKRHLSALLRPFSLIEARLEFRANFISLSDAKSLLLYYNFFDDKMLYLASFYNQLLMAYPSICQHNNIFLFYNELYNHLIKEETTSIKSFLVFFINFLGLLDTTKLDNLAMAILTKLDFKTDFNYSWPSYHTARLLEILYQLKPQTFKSLELLKSLYPSLLN